MNFLFRNERNLKRAHEMARELLNVIAQNNYDCFTGDCARFCKIIFFGCLFPFEFISPCQVKTQSTNFTLRAIIFLRKN